MSNYQIAFNHALEGLRAKDPAVVVRNAAVEYCDENQQYLVPFCKRPCVVSVETGEVYDWASGRRCALGVGIMILHYLAYAQDIVPSERLISLKEVPNGGMLFFPAFQKNVISALARTFECDLEGFMQCAAMLGGEKIKLGHAAARFEAFPKVPLIVALWSGDEEVPGAANFLFDSTVEHFSPVETIIGYGYFLAHKLLKYSRAAGRTINGKDDPFWDEL